VGSWQRVGITSDEAFLRKIIMRLVSI